ncbi:MAG: Gfo/Idh/MocA family protein [Acidobacteriota bacterium]
MAATLRWGILGTAHINRRLIPALRTARRSSLGAIASREAARAAAYAREWGIPTAHESYERLLKDPRVDAVYVPLPNTLHVEWTLRALDAGKHVLCEKPLALTPEDIDRVEAVARARERVAAEAFMYRHEPLIGHVLTLLDAGAVGPIQAIASGFTFSRNRTNDIRLDPSLGGGSLWDIGCYAVGVARLVAGAEPVEAFGWAARAPSGVDDTFTGLLRFPGDLVASVHSSFTTSNQTWLDVSGTEGHLHVSDPFRPAPRHAIEIRRGDQVEVVTVEGSTALFVRMVEDFVAHALDGRPAVVTLAESRGTAGALAALERSAREGRPIQL